MAGPPLFVLDLGFVPGPLKLCILSVLAPYCGRVEIVTECIGQTNACCFPDSVVNAGALDTSSPHYFSIVLSW